MTLTLSLEVREVRYTVDGANFGILARREAARFVMIASDVKERIGFTGWQKRAV
jgi:hypothetical protein